MKLGQAHLFFEPAPLGLKSDPSRIDDLSFFGEVAFVLGHDVIRVLFGMMEIAGLPFNGKTAECKLLQTEIKESLVVGL